MALMSVVVKYCCAGMATFAGHRRLPASQDPGPQGYQKEKENKNSIAY